MKNNQDEAAALRMENYLSRVATGPKMSRDLTSLEAEDALTLILESEVSLVRQAIFLVAMRMKRETEEENLGFWNALDKTTDKRELPFKSLLCMADAFDGVTRVPYFGFFVMPLIANMGLPVYGHSSLAHPPKHGITFETVMREHYQISASVSYDQRIAAINEHKFGFISCHHSHPALESLRALRVEMVKRPMLATFEKMLTPLSADRNYLVTHFFHRGYETPMLNAAKISDFHEVLLGNGMEGTTLFGIHKKTNVFHYRQEKQNIEEHEFHYMSLYPREISDEIIEVFATLKSQPLSLDYLTQEGEDALGGKDCAARYMLAHHAALILCLLGQRTDLLVAFDEAMRALKKGDLIDTLHRYIDTCSKP